MCVDSVDMYVNVKVPLLHGYKVIPIECENYTVQMYVPITTTLI